MKLHQIYPLNSVLIIVFLSEFKIDYINNAVHENAAM